MSRSGLPGTCRDRASYRDFLASWLRGMCAVGMQVPNRAIIVPTHSRAAGRAEPDATRKLDAYRRALECAIETPFSPLLQGHTSHVDASVAVGCTDLRRAQQ